MQTAEDLKIIAKVKQVNRLLLAPYRKGLNYLKLLDMRKDFEDKLYNNSLDRVFGR